MPLIFQSTAVARPAFYDRNPHTGALVFGPSGQPPHAVTNRTSLTVASDHKAWLDSVWVEMYRSNAAGPSSDHGMILQYTPQGGVAGPLFEIRTLDNTVGLPFNGTLPTEGFLNPGDLVQVQTFDFSTGGQVIYTTATKYTLFDP